MQENQRIRLTRSLLPQSLLQHLRGWSIHAISAREICETAQINRTPFYRHDGSQYDLLREMENEVPTHIDARLSASRAKSAPTWRRLRRSSHICRINLSFLAC